MSCDAENARNYPQVIEEMDKISEHLGRQRNMEKVLSIKYMKHLTLMAPITPGKFLDFHLPLRKDTMEASILWKMVFIFIFSY
jgi:hypothetical protein